MRAFRALNEQEIECRISEMEKNGAGLYLLLYKTARTDAALLDEVYGAENWQNDFKVLDGRLYGGIGIKLNGEWVWRWDCGTESGVEKEKGQASDAFKRAGFKWGIGAELYTAPRIFIPADRCRLRDGGGALRCYDGFSVEKIVYDGAGSITAVSIRNDATGKRCFVWQKRPA